MCGIAGFVDFSGHLDPGGPAALGRMDQALARRGPDGWGRTLLSGATIEDLSPRGTRTLTRLAAATTRPSVGLVHRRLSIIDLSEGGHQPMATADHSSWMVYNGELYNYRALRDGLVSTGTGIRTASDTEVLLALLATRDLQALPRLRGMFAFAWWDERAERLVLARDRFGIKPLVFAESRPGRWSFASDPGALAAAGDVALRSEPSARASVLARGSVDVDASFWQGVDVAGDTLSCVIIDRLPFASPGDPLVKARIDAIDQRGGNAFQEYQIPLATLTLLQGLGRLIRTRTDRGVLAILDPRLTKMAYGRRFLKSFPPAPITSDLAKITDFFRE